MAYLTNNKLYLVLTEQLVIGTMSGIKIKNLESVIFKGKCVTAML